LYHESVSVPDPGNMLSVASCQVVCMLFSLSTAISGPSEVSVDSLLTSWKTDKLNNIVSVVSSVMFVMVFQSVKMPSIVMRVVWFVFMNGMNWIVSALFTFPIVLLANIVIV